MHIYVNSNNAVAITCKRQWETENIAIADTRFAWKPGRTKQKDVKTLRNNETRLTFYLIIKVITINDINYWNKFSLASKSHSY